MAVYARRPDGSLEVALVVGSTLFLFIGTGLLCIIAFYIIYIKYYNSNKIVIK